MTQQDTTGHGGGSGKRERGGLSGHELDNTWEVEVNRPGSMLLCVKFEMLTLTMREAR